MSQFQTHLPLGTILDKNFRIEKALGQGGYGITYLATDIALNRPVAIKEFFPKDFCYRNEYNNEVLVALKSNEELVERLKVKFLKEARNIARFNCPYIIKIFTVFRDNNTAYYVMEYVDGVNLYEMVRHQGPLKTEVAIDYIQKIGSALEYIHAQHLNHLDVKPANIMIRHWDNHPLLIDFGLSKEYNAQGQQTSTTPTGISHGYAPIEQYNSEGINKFSPTTDLYSLAATLYYLITGVKPPEAAQLLNEPLKFPSTVPAYLQKAIIKAMSIAQKDRHQSVREFVAEITNSSVLKENAGIEIEPITGSMPMAEEATEMQIDSEATKMQSPTSNDYESEDESESKRRNKFLIPLIAMISVCIFAIAVLLSKSKDEEEDRIFTNNETQLEIPTDIESPIELASEATQPLNNESDKLEDVVDKHENTAQKEIAKETKIIEDPKTAIPLNSNSSKIFSNGKDEIKNQIPQTMGSSQSNDETRVKIKDEPKPVEKKEEPKEEKPKVEEKKVFESVEQMPQYPGGDGALQAYIASHIKYPEEAAKNGIQGRVTVRFVIKPDGSVSDIKVLRSTAPELNKEAIRVCSTLPKFIPGKMNGKPVSVYFTLPINFKLQ